MPFSDSSALSMRMAAHTKRGGIHDRHGIYNSSVDKPEAGTILGARL